MENIKKTLSEYSDSISEVDANEFESSVAANHHPVDSNGNDIIADDTLAQDQFRITQSQLLTVLERVRIQLNDIIHSADYHQEILYPLNSLSVLKIDLGQSSSSSLSHRRSLVGGRLNQTDEFITSLEPLQQTQLLTQKLHLSVEHLDRLKLRIEDVSCKVLVTGDVNCGKSTLINALLKRNVLPMDQQPCTGGFVEIIDASRNESSQCEEVHAIRSNTEDGYQSSNLLTFNRYDLTQLNDLIMHGNSGDDSDSVSSDKENSSRYASYKVYCRNQSESILHNGVTDVNFIDSPGLNRDTAKTMSVFARQDEIDAVIFVVNAENHFTMSGVDFITGAGKEKPLMFIAVNKFDSIVENDPHGVIKLGSKERCKRSILKQVRSILPQTFAKNKEFVHFISAKDYLNNQLRLQSLLEKKSFSQLDEKDKLQSNLDVAFTSLEQNLKSFLIHKRILSKLFPAKSFLENLLADLIQISSYNSEFAASEFDSSESELKMLAPKHENLKQFKNQFEFKVDEISREIDLYVQQQSRVIVEKYAENVHNLVHSVDYPGILRIWQYADAIIRRCNQELIREFLNLETSTSQISQSQIQKLYELAEKNIDDWNNMISLEQVFNVFPIGVVDVGLRSESLIQPRLDITDFLEIPQNFAFIGVSALGSGVIVGGFIGYGKVISGIYNTGKALGLETASQWFWASVSVASVGTIAVVLMDAQNTFQRRIIRKIRNQVRRSARVKSQVDKISYGKKSLLDQLTFEFRRTIFKAVENSEKKLFELNDRVVTAVKRKAFFEGMKYKSSGLLDALTAIDVDVNDGLSGAFEDKRPTGILQRNMIKTLNQ